MKQPRETFSTRFGIITAVTGSVIGLGNIWKFPYLLGQHGGSAFLIVYILFIVVLGLPVMLAELAIGRMGHSNAVHSFHNIAPDTRWKVVGALGVLAAFIILSFYTTVAGWTLEYMVNSFTIGSDGSPLSDPSAFFNEFIKNPVRPVLWQLLFVAITGAIVIWGVKRGIEKASKVLMPLLLLLIVVLCARVLTLPKGLEGLFFLCKPDFSKINAVTCLYAMGHAFFSLSLGLGVMITYGSYIGKSERINRIAGHVVLSDTIFSVLSALLILGAAFAFGVQPDAGPSLVFVTLPNTFNSMPGGAFFSLLFFLLLAIAALTSTISLLEVVVAYAQERFRITRRNATLVACLGSLVLGIPSTLSFGGLKGVRLLGRNLFEFFDVISSNIMLPLGALLVVIFVGWLQSSKNLKAEITNSYTLKARYFPALHFVLRYITPGLILIILISGILAL